MSSAIERHAFTLCLGNDRSNACLMAMRSLDVSRFSLGHEGAYRVLSAVSALRDCLCGSDQNFTLHTSTC